MCLGLLFFFFKLILPFTSYQQRGCGRQLGDLGQVIYPFLALAPRLLNEVVEMNELGVSLWLPA